MKSSTLAHWNERGWLLDGSLISAPGEIVNTGGGPYYVSEEKEEGYLGHSRPLIVSRYLVGTILGRPLNRNELVRFRSSNKKDFRLPNLILHSKQASAADLYKVNRDPILGYSHCMCGCGTELDLQRQKEQPYAFYEGHRPKPKEKKPSRKPKRKSPEKKIEEIREDLKKVGQPLLVVKKSTTPCTDAVMKMLEPQEDPMKEFRVLFEKMIHNLPWAEFKELLTLLLEIHTRKDSR